MVQAFGKFVDIKQHGAQHIEKALGLIAGAALHHHAERTQHRRDGGVFVANDLKRGIGHGQSLARALAPHFDPGQSRRSFQRLSSSAFEITLTLERAIAAMQTMQHMLAHRIHCCQRKDRPECPIFDGLAGQPAGK